LLFYYYCSVSGRVTWLWRKQAVEKESIAINEAAAGFFISKKAGAMRMLLQKAAKKRAFLQEYFMVTKAGALGRIKRPGPALSKIKNNPSYLQGTGQNQKDTETAY